MVTLSWEYAYVQMQQNVHNSNILYTNDITITLWESLLTNVLESTKVVREGSGGSSRAGDLGAET